MADRGRKDSLKGLEPVGKLLSALLEARGLSETVERAGALACWDELVGPQIARVARPAGLRDGTLFVEVRSAAWSMELNMMRRRLLERLNEGRERGRIERLVFLQADRERRRAASDTIHGERGHGESDR